MLICEQNKVYTLQGIVFHKIFEISEGKIINYICFVWTLFVFTMEYFALLKYKTISSNCMNFSSYDWRWFCMSKQEYSNEEIVRAFKSYVTKVVKNAVIDYARKVKSQNIEKFFLVSV